MARDLNYWEKYYAERRAPGLPSHFARYCLEKYLKTGMDIIELGCGNCRDALFFADAGLNVTGVDQCSSELEYLRQNYRRANLALLPRDFTRLENRGCFHAVYTRFSLHAITETDEDRVLEWCAESLCRGGMFLLEGRGVLNSLYRQGRQMPGDRDAYVCNRHYRRFLRHGDLCRKLAMYDFSILEAVEARGFAPAADADDIFLRIIARKQ